MNGFNEITMAGKTVQKHIICCEVKKKTALFLSEEPCMFIVIPIAGIKESLDKKKHLWLL